MGAGGELAVSRLSTRIRPKARNVKLFNQKGEHPPRKNLAFPTPVFISSVSMSLEGPDQLRLRAAHGYIEIGLFLEANAELEKITPSCRHAPEVLDSRVVIYQGLQNWDLMAIVAKQLVEWNPGEAAYFLHLAYALRRAASLRAAHAILTNAAELHPREGLIQFNLACYETQLGNLDQAKAHLKRATKINPKFKLMALEDPDLEPLWTSLATEQSS